jgi:hypothetical protein
MRAQRSLTLLAILALVSPLAATAAPACAPGQHCPMAGMGESAPPCHGSTIQAADCCVSAEIPEAVEVATVVVAPAAAAAAGAPAPRLAGDGVTPSALPVEAASPPLYRLFRALLI